MRKGKEGRRNRKEYGQMDGNACGPYRMAARAGVILQDGHQVAAEANAYLVSLKTQTQQ